MIGQESVWVGTWNHGSGVISSQTHQPKLSALVSQVFSSSSLSSSFMTVIIHYDIIYFSAWWEGTYLDLDLNTPQPASCGKSPSGVYFSQWCRPPVPQGPQPLLFPVQPPMICSFGCGNLILDHNWKNKEGCRVEKKRERVINKMSTTKLFTLLLSDKCEWKVVLW